MKLKLLEENLRENLWDLPWWRVLIYWQPIAQNVKGHEETFHQRGYVDVKWALERMFNISSHQKNAKTWAITTHLTEQLKLKTVTISNADKDVEKLDLHTLVVGMQNGTGTLEKKFDNFLHKQIYTYYMTQPLHFWAFIPAK